MPGPSSFDGVARRPLRLRGGRRAFAYAAAALLALAPDSARAAGSRVSVEPIEVDPYPLYYAEYRGDYGFRKLLYSSDAGAALGPADASGKLDAAVSCRIVDADRTAGAGGARCSCFLAAGGTGALFGRNYDWNYRGGLLLFTRPAGAFASLAMVDLRGLGLPEGKPPRGRAAESALLNAPYWCVDGMNERGLAIAELSVPIAEPPRDPAKKSLGTDSIIRLVLDYGADVDSAIALIRSYSVDFGKGEKVHYFLADSSGASAVVEFIAGRIEVERGGGKWQACANTVVHALVPPPGAAAGYVDAASNSLWRYAVAILRLADVDGDLSAARAMGLLRELSMDFRPSYDVYTVWSVVYDLKALEARVVMGREYSTVRDFALRTR